MMSHATRELSGSLVAFHARLLCIFLLSFSCSDKSQPIRNIRGHTQIIQGVSHGVPASRPLRYCKNCHGTNLAGGSNLEPSCYQCHGRNWSDDDLGPSLAPSDHTELKGSWSHHADFPSPTGVCDQCHGAALEGDASGSRPSCYLCHDKIWN
jgi:hypothetical protein